ncbi:hypothetical protein ACFVZL_40610 [Streptomyces sp. NPDC058320]|uniref:hypothetical protein n=1 Tax=unclassified Streptomyces TaxID=2593676 RepID=UPI00364075F3
MFRRSKKAEDHDHWIVEQSASGGLVRWARIDEIFPEAVPALEQGARERGMTYRDYVTWVAALRKEEIFGYRDQIRNGDESAIPRHVYEAWDYVHMRLRERQFAEEKWPGGLLFGWAVRPTGDLGAVSLAFVDGTVPIGSRT